MIPTPTPAAKTPECTVFELVNGAKKEFYVGITAEPFPGFFQQMKAAPPAAIGHWGIGDSIIYRCVESRLTPDGAAQFLRWYETTLGKAGWRVIRAAPPQL